MSVFEAYQEEFQGKATGVRALITELQETPNSETDAKNAKRDAINKVLLEMTDILKQMDVDVRGYDKETKRQYNEILGKDREEMATLNNQFNAALYSLEKSALIGGKSGEDRRRVIDANQK